MYNFLFILSIPTLTDLDILEHDMTQAYSFNTYFLVSIIILFVKED